LNGADGAPTITIGAVAIMLTGSNAVSGSYGVALTRCGPITMVPLTATPSV